jgi:hypothetical protein
MNCVKIGFSSYSFREDELRFSTCILLLFNKQIEFYTSRQ